MAEITDITDKKTGNGQRSGKKKKKNNRRLIIPLYIITVIILIVLVYAFPTISGAFSETMTVKYGTLDDSYDVTCYIVRDETVYYSDTDGSVAYHFAEGDGVRANTQVVTLTAGDGASEKDYSAYNKRANSVKDVSAVLSPQDRLDLIKSELRQKADEATADENTEEADRINKYLSAVGNLSDDGTAADNSADDSVPDDPFGVKDGDTAKASGTLSYMIDGYESVLNPYTIGLLDKDKLESLNYDSYNANTGKTCKGEPLFKVVDRYRWYAVTWVDASALGSFSEETSVDLKLPKGSVQGKVSKLYDDGDEIMVVMEFKCYYEDLASIRKIKTSITASDHNGLLIDSSFIVTKDGQPGVYVVGVSGKTSFTPVKILNSDGQYTIVAANYYYEQSDEGSKQVETVSPYDEIKKISQEDTEKAAKKEADQQSSDSKSSSGDTGGSADNSSKAGK